MSRWIGWSIAAILVGMLAGSVIVAGFEYVGFMIHDVPKDLNTHDPKAMESFMQTAPTTIFLPVLLAWIVGPFVGGWVAAVLAKVQPMPHAMVVGCIFMAGGLANLYFTKHPLWFTLTTPFLFIPMACLGGWLGKSSPIHGRR